MDLIRNFKNFEELHKINELSTEEYKKIYELGLKRKDTRGKRISEKALEGFLKNLSDKYRGMSFRFTNDGGISSRDRDWHRGYNNNGINPIATAEIKNIYKHGNFRASFDLTGFDSDYNWRKIEGSVILSADSKGDRPWLSIDLYSNLNKDLKTPLKQKWELDTKSAKLISHINNEICEFLGSDIRWTKNDLPQF